MSFRDWLAAFFLPNRRMKTILTVAGIPVVEHPDGSVTWTAGAMVDSDGSGPSHGDPDWQHDTSEHDTENRALNADEVPYIVVPPQLRDTVPGVVLGCQARVVNTQNGHQSDAVVGDIGPHSKLGEISVAAARALGIPSSPVNGGTSAKVVAYTIWPGKPAVVHGVKYPLTAVG